MYTTYIVYLSDLLMIIFHFFRYNFAKNYAILISANYHLIQDIKKEIKRDSYLVYKEQNFHQIFLKCHFDITREHVSRITRNTLAKYRSTIESLSRDMSYRDAERFFWHK